MIRFYGSKNCVKCEEMKKRLEEQGMEYIYADAEFIDLANDITAKVIIVSNNLELPVVYDTDTGAEIK